MANPQHEAILRYGAEYWNRWRKDNPEIRPDLERADFSRAKLNNVDLSGANLIHVNFYDADLIDAILIGVNLRDAILIGANLTRINLGNANLRYATLTSARIIGADLHNADLRRVSLTQANLANTDLSFANLMEADLMYTDMIGINLKYAKLFGANLTGVNLNNANLNGADLSRATLIETNFEYADISDCRIYGISAWNLKTENLTQDNLIITQGDEPEITVDNIEIAQFVYLLLNNSKLRGVIDTLTTKSVLILGRFTPERKAVLDGIREALRQHDYVPMLFDFEKPANRDLTETVMTLASLARFVIADLSDPNSIPHELMSFADKLFSVPVQGIFCPTEAHPQPYPMYEHLRRLPHVLPIYRYETAEGLMAALEEYVIRPAEEKVKAVRPTSGVL